MCLRKVSDYRSPYLIQKSVSLNRKIQKIKNLEDLVENKEYFTKREYLMLYQQFLELEIYNDATWDERAIIAPIIDFFYDRSNCPVLVYPKFEPIASESDSFRLDEDEAIAAIQEFLSKKGLDDNEIGIFIQKIINFCDEYNLRQDDILLNVNNLGYSEIFGPRIIDYGLDYEVADYFIKKDSNENECLATER